MMRGGVTGLWLSAKPIKKSLSKKGRVSSLAKKYPILGKPIIRGSVALVESLIFGIKCLTFSANVYAEEERRRAFCEGPDLLTFRVAVVLTVGFYCPAGIYYSFNPGCHQQ